MAVLSFKTKPGSRANQLPVSANGTPNRAPARLPDPRIFGTSKDRVELLSGRVAPVKKLDLRNANDDELAAVRARHRVGWARAGPGPTGKL